MIVGSGILVAVAAALLVDGVLFTSADGTPWQVWVSIGLSVVAFAIVVVGSRRERTRLPDAATAAPVAPAPPAPPRPPVSGPSATTHDEATLPPLPPPTPPALPEPPPATPAPVEEGASAGDVLVIAGAPHYHLAGCDTLESATGTPAHPLPVEQARAVGYTSCPVCRPDAMLDLLADDDADVLAEELTGATAASELSARPDPEVIVVRRHFHRPDCRYVAVATEQQAMPRSRARAEGAQPCGVCLP